MKIITTIFLLLLSILPNRGSADIRMIWDDEKKSKKVGDGIFIVDPLVEIMSFDEAKEEIFTMPTDGRISSLFGWRVDPFTGSSKFHSGLDVANRRNSNIFSSSSGRVSFAGFAGGCGVMVTIKHSEGVETRYCHLSRALIGRGERVGGGELIGLMGSTGRSTSSHLHFELRRDGTPVDPVQYLVF